MSSGIQGSSQVPQIGVASIEVSDTLQASDTTAHLAEIGSHIEGPIEGHETSPVDLGQITRQYRDTETPPAPPLERFMYQDISHEPWPKIARKALSDSGWNVRSLTELNQRVALASVSSVLGESNSDPFDLEEASCSIHPQASGASETGGGGERKRNLDEAELHVHDEGSEKVFKRRDTKEDR